MNVSITRDRPPETPDRVRVLTGDRPTGSLHLGHFVGSLKNRVALQQTHDQTILIADMQALTDNAHRSATIAANVFDVVRDYLAAGIDPAVSHIVLQSGLPALNELAMLYMNVVTVARLERNPTVKSEIVMRGFERDIPAGFLMYPVSQAADITAFRATVVPVGGDQTPMIEQTNEIVDSVNRMAGAHVLERCSGLYSPTTRLPGADGRKASKSLGNALSLSASPNEVAAFVQSMFTDPNHLRIADPGTVEGNVVFAYLDAFYEDTAAVEELKEHYRRGGLGDSMIKKRLVRVLETVLVSIRERRAAASLSDDDILTLLSDSTRRAAAMTESVLSDVRAAFGVMRLD
ncbi:MAG: tryptophan--tRNA ligase [Gemmatimonadota bacterium]|nr:tryptophan--tRNA ligase [Gemmatimonadota bacterium]